MKNFCTEDSPRVRFALKAIESEGRKRTDATPNAISFRLATGSQSPRMRIDLLVTTSPTARCTTGSWCCSRAASAQLHTRAGRGARFHTRHENYEKVNGQNLNVGMSDANVSKRSCARRSSGRFPTSRSSGADRQGPRPAQLHRVQRQDRGDRLPATGFARCRHPGTDQGLYDDTQHLLWKRVNRRRRQLSRTAMPTR